MRVSELIAALVGTMKLDGDRDVLMSISDGPRRSSTIEVVGKGFHVWLRDDPDDARLLADAEAARANPQVGDGHE